MIGVSRHTLRRYGRCQTNEYESNKAENGSASFQTHYSNSAQPFVSVKSVDDSAPANVSRLLSEKSAGDASELVSDPFWSWPLQSDSTRYGVARASSAE